MKNTQGDDRDSGNRDGWSLRLHKVANTPEYGVKCIDNLLHTLTSVHFPARGASVPRLPPRAAVCGAK